MFSEITENLEFGFGREGGSFILTLLLLHMEGTTPSDLIAYKTS